VFTNEWIIKAIAPLNLDIKQAINLGIFILPLALYIYTVFYRCCGKGHHFDQQEDNAFH